MTPGEPKIIIRDEALVAITSDGERPATPDEAFNWCIDQARKEAWAEGYYAGVTENYDPGDEEEAEEIRDRANGHRNPYQEEN